MLRYPLRKEYSIITKTNFWNLILNYKQAIAEDTIGFFNLKDMELYKYLANFIEDNAKYEYILKRKWYRTKKKYLLKRLEIENLILTNAIQNSNLLTKIKDSLHNIVKSVYDEINNKDWWYALDNITYLEICKRYSINWPKELLENYTFEQISYMLDWILYINNTKSKEWEYKNKIAMSRMINKQTPKEVVDKLKKFRAMIQKK